MRSITFRLSGLSEPDLASEPSAWARSELAAALARRGAEAVLVSDETPKAAVPTEPQSFLIARAADGTIEVHAGDVRGLVYALTEVADRVTHGEDLEAALGLERPIVERPASEVRSISRLFSSASHDKAWFHDEAFWTSYLGMLAANRFSRFSLTFGMAYNYPYDNEFLSDVYLHFAYPFLLHVPGYDVRVEGLPEAERQKNLAMLRFIGREAVRRGLHFQLALWTHGYDFDAVPDANYQIRGLDPRIHAGYCRDALAMLLRECPDIAGVTLRVHVESGIPEGDRQFWPTLFEAFAAAGRRVEIDLHAKGVHPSLIEAALATGQPVTVSPKYVGEHMGLPAHPASIRGPERIRYANALSQWSLSEGTRRFLRYGYGDLLADERSYGVIYRIWPGTQRLLMSGDPAMAAGYGRAASFGGALGIELCEPLSFRGRMGTGPGADRTGYRKPDLIPRHDWEKYAYLYRVWGRLAWSPDTDPDGWRRYLRTACGAAAEACETALAQASRILPLVTLTHAPSASNNTYWPEIYWNMSLVDEAPSYPYGYDMARPARYGTVGAFDPQLFMSAAEWAADVSGSAPVRRHSPLQVAAWLEHCAATAGEALESARRQAPADSPAFRRLDIDVGIQAGLGRFFAHKNRAACLWELYSLTGSGEAAHRSIAEYRQALAAWDRAIAAAGDAYEPDLAFGSSPWMKGHWADRREAIASDIALMVKLVRDHPVLLAAPPDPIDLDAALAARPVAAEIRHVPPPLRPGSDLPIDIVLDGDAAGVVLHYRAADQSKPWSALPMEREGCRYAARIPAAATGSGFAVQYYFEVTGGAVSALHPGFGPDLAGQPYFLASRAPASGDARTRTAAVNPLADWPITARAHERRRR